jgi:hypothetical protein
MSSPAPHLLGLPREIRDIIYGYLYHDIELDWGYSITPFPADAHYFQKVRFENLPLPNVHLSCSRLHEEYRQAKHLQTPSLTIFTTASGILPTQPTNPTNHVRVVEILRNIRHVDFVLGNTDLIPLADSWRSVTDLSIPINLIAPKLNSIKVSTQPMLCRSSPRGALEGPGLPESVPSWGRSSPKELAEELAGRFKLDAQRAFWHAARGDADTSVGAGAIVGDGRLVVGEWLFTRSTASLRSLPAVLGVNSAGLSFDSRAHAV